MTLRSKLIAGAAVLVFVGAVLSSGSKGKIDEIEIEKFNIQGGENAIEETDYYLVRGDFTQTGGTLTNEGTMKVHGDFYLSKEAVFDNKGTLILEGNKRTKIVPATYRPAVYGPKYAYGPYTTTVYVETGSYVNIDGETVIIPATTTITNHPGTTVFIDYENYYTATGTTVLYGTGELISPTILLTGTKTTLYSNLSIEPRHTKFIDITYPNAIYGTGTVIVQTNHYGITSTGSQVAAFHKRLDANWYFWNWGEECTDMEGNVYACWFEDIVDPVIVENIYGSGWTLFDLGDPVPVDRWEWITPSLGNVEFR